jgi:hypothetical protein
MGAALFVDATKERAVISWVLECGADTPRHYYCFDIYIYAVLEEFCSLLH